ncbi:MAG: hypothetical protein ABWZ64_18510 [Xanthobacteraceae bacterium]
MIKNQRTPSALTATPDWVRAGILPARAARQFGHAQFHCGSPPPAEVPSNRTRIFAPPPQASSDRTRIAGAFEKDWHVLNAGLDPLFLCAGYLLHNLILIIFDALPVIGWPFFVIIDLIN